MRRFIRGRSSTVGWGCPELKRLRELEAENARLKKRYADLAFEKEAA